MANASDRKVIGKYRYAQPRRVRFSTATGTRETTCLTDVVRDMLSSRIASRKDPEAGVEWNASELARQLGMAVSTLHGLTNGDREPNLQHLERLCALANSTVLEVFFATSTFVTSEVRAQIENGENPFAELRLRGNLEDEQIERIGRVVERAAVTDNVEWLIALIEKAGEALEQIQKRTI